MQWRKGGCRRQPHSHTPRYYHIQFQLRYVDITGRSMAMTDEIGMWEIDEGSQAEVVSKTDRASTEQLLEDVLAANPDMLLPHLTLVGRQAPTDSGYLDLMGLDSDGKLALFELKRGTLTRDAVAQVLDYGSYLESLPNLEDYIVRQAGRNGIEQIEDFEAWYSEHFDEQEIVLRPVRMILVGLGVDGKAKRMVEFLQERGVNIHLMTFHGFLHQGQTLLVKQVEAPEISGRDSGSQIRRRRMSKAEHWDRIRNLARERNAEHLEEATEILRHEGRYYHTEYGTTFINSRIVLPKEAPAQASHSVVLDRSNNGIIKILLIRDTPHVRLYGLNVFRMRGSRLWGSRLHRACVV